MKVFSFAVGADQIGVDRLHEIGIVKHYGNVVAGLLADPFPAGADLGIGAHHQAVVGGILALASLGRHEPYLGVEAQRFDGSGIAVGCAA